jgi:hydrogenase-4 component H
MPHDVLDRFLRPLRRAPLTRRYPYEPADLPPSIAGLPVVSVERCDATAACVRACPTGAIRVDAGTWTVDAGRCIFCRACEAACPSGAIGMSGRFELAARDRTALVVRTGLEGPR